MLQILTLQGTCWDYSAQSSDLDCQHHLSHLQSMTQRNQSNQAYHSRCKSCMLPDSLEIHHGHCSQDCGNSCTLTVKYCESKSHHLEFPSMAQIFHWKERCRLDMVFLDLTQARLDIHYKFLLRKYMWCLRCHRIPLKTGRVVWLWWRQHQKSWSYCKERHLLVYSLQKWQQELSHKSTNSWKSTTQA